MNLRGPWQTERLAGLEELPDFPPQVKLPATWEELFGRAVGTVSFTRNLGCPTNLTPESRVFLVLDDYRGQGTASFNGSQLGEISAENTAAEFEVTPLLQRRNQVQITLTVDPGAAENPGGLPGLIGLEIEEPEPV